MPEEPRQQLPHLHIRGTARPEPYTYPLPVRGPKFELPARDRIGHSDRLLGDLRRTREVLDDLHARRNAVGIAVDRGLYLEFESDPGFELMLKSLDRTREGIELAAVRQRGDVMLATVFVAEGKLQNLERLIRAYRDEDDARHGAAKEQEAGRKHLRDSPGCVGVILD